MSGTIKLNKDLRDRVERCAKVGGYSSAQEFVEHIIERELAKLEADTATDEQIVNKLKGLGYID